MSTFPQQISRRMVKSCGLLNLLLNIMFFLKAGDIQAQGNKQCGPETRSE